MSYEFLDAFLQHRVMPTVIMDQVPQSIQNAFRAQNVYHSGQHGNIMTKRLNKRMGVLIEKAGYDYARVDQYLGSDIKLRELGFEKGPLDQKTSSVRNHQHNINEGWRKWWATEKGKTELKQQGLEGQQPLPPNIPIKWSSYNGISASSTPSRSLSSPDVPIPPPSHLSRTAPVTKTPAAIGGLTPAIIPSSTVAGPAAHRSVPVVPAAPTVRPWNGKIEFSASITDGSLGHFEGGPFWANKHEYLHHVEEIIRLNAKCKKLLTWIVEHDPAAKGSSVSQEDSVSQALLYLIDAETDERYKQFDRNGHVPLSGTMEGNAIVIHLEAEIAVLLKECPNVHNVAVLKEKAQRRQVALHKAIAQSLASIISMVLFSERQNIFHAATDRDRLHHARVLVSAMDDAMKAQYLQNASIKQKFFYDDELKTAMALDIQEKAKERLGAEFDVEDAAASKKKGKKQAKAKESDAEFLQVMLEQTRYQRAQMIDTQLRVFPDDPLNATLQTEAERNYDEIVEQILVEQQNLNKPKVSTKPAEQPAPEEGQPSDVSDPVQDSGQATHRQPSVDAPAPTDDQSPKADKVPEKRARDEGIFGDDIERRPTKRVAGDTDVAAMKGMAPPRDSTAAQAQQQDKAAPRPSKKNSYKEFLDARDAEKRRAKEERNRPKAAETQTEEAAQPSQILKRKAVTFDLPPDALNDESAPVAPRKRLFQKDTAEDEVSKSTQAVPQAKSVLTTNEASSSGAADASDTQSLPPNPKKRRRDEEDDVDAEATLRSMKSPRLDHAVLDSASVGANQDVDANDWVAMLPELDALMPQTNGPDDLMPRPLQMADFEIDNFDPTLPFGSTPTFDEAAIDPALRFDPTLAFDETTIDPALPFDGSSFDDAQAELSAWANQAYAADSGSGADDWMFADGDGASAGNDIDTPHGGVEEEVKKIDGSASES